MIQNIQALRGFAALIVVIIHLLSTHPSISIGKVHQIFGWIGPIGVDVFFVISGFVVTLSAFNSFKRNGSLSEFIIKRLVRVYPLYWIVFCIASLFVGTLYLSPEWLPKESNFNLFFLIKETNYKVMVAWTLHYEVYFYLLLSFILLLRLKSFWRGCAILSIIQLILFISTYTNFSYYGNILLSSGILIDFSLGGLLCYLYLNNYIYNGKIFTILGIILLSITIILHANFAITPWSVGWRILFGIAAAVLIYGLIGLEKIEVYLSKRLQRIGDFSYSLYLWHQLLFASLFYIFSKYGLIPENKIYITFILLSWLILVFYLTKLSYRYIELPIMKMINNFYKNKN